MDPREVLEREAEQALEAAKARVREAVEGALEDVLRDIGANARNALQAAAAGDPANRVTRTEAARMFGVNMSRLRTLERHGVITPRRRGGRIMLDVEEVAAALGQPAGR